MSGPNSSDTLVWTNGTTTNFEISWDPTEVTTSGGSTYKLFWEHETKLDEEEREALIGTVIDSIIAARDNPFSGLRALLEHLPEPMESEPSGFVHVPEGAGFAPTVWTGSSTYSPSTSSTTTWYSSTREGTYTTGHWEY
jgi:hypothetical protein